MWIGCDPIPKYSGSLTSECKCIYRKVLIPLLCVWAFVIHLDETWKLISFQPEYDFFHSVKQKSFVSENVSAQTYFFLFGVDSFCPYVEFYFRLV